MLLFFFSSRNICEKAAKVTPLSVRAFSLLASALMSRRKAFASFSVLKNRVFCLPRPSVTVARHGDFLSST